MDENQELAGPASFSQGGFFLRIAGLTVAKTGPKTYVLPSNCNGSADPPFPAATDR
jgi:hypothetical protein